MHARYRVILIQTLTELQQLVDATVADAALQRARTTLIANYRCDSAVICDGVIFGCGGCVAHVQVYIVSHLRVCVNMW